MFEDKIKSFLYQQAKFCATNRLSVLFVVLVIGCFSGLGLPYVTLEEEPAKLWVEPGSIVALEKEHYDTTFNPFYRTQQAIITRKADHGQEKHANILTYENLLALSYRIEELQTNLIFTKSDYGQTIGQKLSDFCWKLVPERPCFIISPMSYFQNNRTRLAEVEHNYPGGIAGWIHHCTTGIFTECFSDFGVPVQHFMVLGGERSAYVPKKINGKFHENVPVVHADALVLTLILHNSQDPIKIAQVQQWEEEVFIANMKEHDKNSKTIDIAFMSERSVVDALHEQTSASIPNAVISYFVMFVYITIALGFFHRVHAKPFVALCGVIFVCFSLLISLGICSYFRISLTLIITDVVPFLLLAIGVDNMFILNTAYWNASQERKYALERDTLTPTEVIDVISECVSEIGGSLITAGLCEISAFTLGALTSMPAVRAFSFFTAIAIASNLVLQMTAFISVLTIDALRVEQDDIDYLLSIPLKLICFVRSRLPSMHKKIDAEVEKLSPKKLPAKLDRLYIRDRDLIGLAGSLRKIMARFYSPAVLENTRNRLMTIVTFPVITLVLLLVAVPHLQIGLDLKDPVPVNHYLRRYFETYEKFVQTGPPVYFVTHSNRVLSANVGGEAINLKLALNYTDPSVSTAISDLSLRLQAETPYIVAQSVASWFNDFRRYLCHNAHTSAINGVQYAVGNGCLQADPSFLSKTLNISYEAAKDINLFDLFQCTREDFVARKVPDALFIPLLRQFVSTKECCMGVDRESGQETHTGICGFQYAPEVRFAKCFVGDDKQRYILPQTLSGPAELTFGNLRVETDGKVYESTKVPTRFEECLGGSRIRTQTIALRTNEDYIGSYLSAVHASSTSVEPKCTKMQSPVVNVYPYSIYFIFYAQYVEISNIAIGHVGTALLVVVALIFGTAASMRTALCILQTLVMMIIDLLAVMALWDIRLNAISVVNLVMSLGIFVEFCVHLAFEYERAFKLGKSSTLHMRSAMVDMGTNVLCGITVTKLLGVSVLNFSPSAMFRIYYFKMYLAIILIGALHGLAFLPALLLQLTLQRKPIDINTAPAQVVQETTCIQVA